MPDGAAVLAAVSSPRRQAILQLIWHEEQPAGAIHAALGDVTFGAVSHHLGALAAAGLVHRRIDGRHRYYRADRAALAPVRALLERLWDDALWRLKLAAELEHARRGPAPGRARSRGAATRRRPRRRGDAR
jgi:DNA-binding transcriptional ArsR family regulator